MIELSGRQASMLMWLRKHDDHIVQIAGYGRAPHLSIAHALVRRGLAFTFRTGCFSLTEEGEERADKLLAEREKKT